MRGDKVFLKYNGLPTCIPVKIRGEQFPPPLAPMVPPALLCSCSFPSCWPISFDSLLRKHGYNGTHSLTFIWNSGVFFQQIILDAGVAKTFFSRIIVLAVFFSVNSIVVFLRELTTKTLCLSIRTIASQWDKMIYEREAFYVYTVSFNNQSFIWGKYMCTCTGGPLLMQFFETLEKQPC